MVTVTVKVTDTSTDTVMGTGTLTLTGTVTSTVTGMVSVTGTGTTGTGIGTTGTGTGTTGTGTGTTVTGTGTTGGPGCHETRPVLPNVFLLSVQVALCPPATAVPVDADKSRHISGGKVEIEAGVGV